MRALPRLLAVSSILLFATIGFAQGHPAKKKAPTKHAAQASAKTAKPTPEEAQRFIDDAEKQLSDLADKGQRADWVNENFITDDTDAIATDANSENSAVTTKLALDAKKYEAVTLPDVYARKLHLLKLQLTLPTPSDPELLKEENRLKTEMQSTYGKGKYCPEAKPGTCYDLTAMEKIMGESRDPEELKDLWIGWHKVSPPMRPKFARFVELANQGAREQGYANMGAMWRSGYDMQPDAFAADLDRVWEQVRPLYLSLHAYVRSQLIKNYGPSAVPAEGPIPAHLLGNMWAQDWSQIYPIVKPANETAMYDLDQILREKKVDARGMVHYGENFFKSIGFAPLPATFWERSLFTKPLDRDVVCHASAWDLDNREDVRLKMCIQIRGEDFVTVHHELGHNFYQLAYRNQPYFFKDSANDGVHEAIGDTIALSVTPEYLQKVGLLQQVPPANNDIPFLLKKALEKVAFLPFGLMIDQWRWKVYSGEIKPADYNKSWWELRRKYQGVAPPIDRSEADFDPGAKFHVAANVPYTRYFLADIYQFQFHRALCKEAGFTGPLNRCSIYGNKAAGAKLNSMLQLGKSKPWQEAFQTMMGEDKADASAILDYFAPLKKWLDEQNAKNGVKVGW